MLKLVAIGLWIILVTAGATVTSVQLASSSDGAAGEMEDLGIEKLTSELMSIPVLRAGDVSGYLILQIAFAADRARLEHMKLDPVPFLKDAAFRVVFTRTDVDVRRLRPGDLDSLTAAIAKEANGRLGEELVRDVLLQQVNYVKKEDIRTNWIGADNAGE